MRANCAVRAWYMRVKCVEEAWKRRCSGVLVLFMLLFMLRLPIVNCKQRAKRESAHAICAGAQISTSQISPEAVVAQVTRISAVLTPIERTKSDTRAN